MPPRCEGLRSDRLRTSTRGAGGEPTPALAGAGPAPDGPSCTATGTSASLTCSPTAEAEGQRAGEAQLTAAGHGHTHSKHSSTVQKYAGGSTRSSASQPPSLLCCTPATPHQHQLPQSSAAWQKVICWTHRRLPRAGRADGQDAPLVRPVVDCGRLQAPVLRCAVRQQALQQAGVAGQWRCEAAVTLSSRAKLPIPDIFCGARTGTRSAATCRAAHPDQLLVSCS